MTYVVAHRLNIPCEIFNILYRFVENSIKAMPLDFRQRVGLLQHGWIYTAALLINLRLLWQYVEKPISFDLYF